MLTFNQHGGIDVCVFSNEQISSSLHKGIITGSGMNNHFVSTIVKTK